MKPEEKIVSLYHDLRDLADILSECYRKMSKHEDTEPAELSVYKNIEDGIRDFLNAKDPTENID